MKPPATSPAAFFVSGLESLGWRVWARESGLEIPGRRPKRRACRGRAPARGTNEERRTTGRGRNESEMDAAGGHLSRRDGRIPGVPSERLGGRARPRTRACAVSSRQPSPRWGAGRGDSYALNQSLFSSNHNTHSLLTLAERDAHSADDSAEQREEAKREEAGAPALRGGCPAD